MSIIEDEEIKKMNIPEKHNDVLTKFAIENIKIFRMIGFSFTFQQDDIPAFVEDVLIKCFNSLEDVEMISIFYRSLIKLINILTDDKNDDSDENEIEKMMDDDMKQELDKLEGTLTKFFPCIEKMRQDSITSCNKLKSNEFDENEFDILCTNFCSNCLFFKSRHKMCSKYEGEHNIFSTCTKCGFEEYDHIACEEFTIEKPQDKCYTSRYMDVCTTCCLPRQKHCQQLEKEGITHCNAFTTDEYGACKNCIFDFTSHCVKNKDENNLKKTIYNLETNRTLNKKIEAIKERMNNSVATEADEQELRDMMKEIKARAKQSIERMEERLKYVVECPHDFMSEKSKAMYNKN